MDAAVTLNYGRNHIHDAYLTPQFLFATGQNLSKKKLIQ